MPIHETDLEKTFQLPAHHTLTFLAKMPIKLWCDYHVLMM
jgi:hypothetical protein